jgi:glycosyltransferase involved in cell wall biosynthesis
LGTVAQYSNVSNDGKYQATLRRWGSAALQFLCDKSGITMLVSAIIPAYNASRFIRETLDSVVQQTHRDLEIIIVDDGSTDDTVRIVTEIQKKDSRLSLYRQTNQGAAVARNLGIEKSKADFIAFLDADDLWHPTKIEKQHDLLLASSDDVGLVYTYSRMIDTDGYIQGHTGARIFRRGHAFDYLLVSNFVGNGSTAMVRRKCLPSLNPFDPGQNGNEDTFFYLRIAAKYKVDVVPEFLIGYRWNTGQNNSTNFDQQILSYESMIAKIYHMYPNISKRVFDWSEAGFYLSYVQTLFKKGRYKQSATIFLKKVAKTPTFVCAPPFRRLVILATKAAYRKIFKVRTERRRYFDMDPKST